MADNEVEVVFGAEVGALNSGMASAASSVKSATDSMRISAEDARAAWAVISAARLASWSDAEVKGPKINPIR
jgi:hypothetical protein